MAEHVILVPDIGEGVAEAELVEWHVALGDLVREEDPLAAVMTDKATVEIPSPVSGEIVWLGGAAGDVVAVGSELARVRVSAQERDAGTGAAPRATRQPTPDAPPDAARDGKPLAAPAVRLRAKQGGVDLRHVPGTGPSGHITHADLDAFIVAGQPPGHVRGQPATAVEDIRLAGLRRRIAERMSIAHARIPHITYVEELDVSEVEKLRARLNEDAPPGHARLTLLPFLMRAMVQAIARQPRLNATFDDEAGVIHQHAAVHIGIATQTASGLVVPVARHVESRDLWECAAEISRLAAAARGGTATSEELTGSTITISSLGAMGGVASTPIINHPEVAIVGVNKIMMRPAWDGTGFVPRRMMNLSSSFDHRVVDGFEAAAFIQRIKTLLETPALIFVDVPRP